MDELIYFWVMFRAVARNLIWIYLNDHVEAVIGGRVWGGLFSSQVG